MAKNNGDRGSICFIMADIEKKLVFKIDKNDKPLIYISGVHKERTSCLIDTGANLPVWLIGKDYLRYRYPDATDSGKLTVINGLGDNPLLDVAVWNLPELVLKDDQGGEIKYKDLPIAVIETSKFSFDMILPLTMLNRMDFSFAYTKSSSYGAFEIRTKKDTFFIRSEYAKVNNHFLNKIQVFAEE